MSATPPVVRQKQEIGLPVADFALPRISGEGERSLADFLPGKRAAVVLFWSGVCSHCLRYDDYLNRFGERHRDVGLVAVASRHGETANRIRATVAERRLTFRSCTMPRGRSRASGTHSRRRAHS
jgi:thiol-disulfide isomerase/thioredoxin